MCHNNSLHLNFDLPIVYEWKEPYASIIDINSIEEVCEWIRKYSKYRPDKDVSDPLYRAVIGFYQIGDLIKLSKKKSALYSMEEVSEAIASVIIHTLASCEMIGIDSSSILIWPMGVNSFLKFIDKNTVDSKSIYEDILYSASQFQRHILYFCMNRKHRFNSEIVRRSCSNLINQLIYAFRHRNWNIIIGLSLCMSKLQDQELNNH